MNHNSNRMRAVAIGLIATGALTTGAGVALGSHSPEPQPMVSDGREPCGIRVRPLPVGAVLVVEPCDREPAHACPNWPAG